jgi:hypothetical protein
MMSKMSNSILPHIFRDHPKLGAMVASALRNDKLGAKYASALRYHNRPYELALSLFAEFMVSKGPCPLCHKKSLELLEDDRPWMDVVCLEEKCKAHFEVKTKNQFGRYIRISGGSDLPTNLSKHFILVIETNQLSKRYVPALMFSSARQTFTNYEQKMIETYDPDWRHHKSPEVLATKRWVEKTQRGTVLNCYRVTRIKKLKECRLKSSEGKQLLLVNNVD